MIEEPLSGALQENLLCLLVFSDQYCKLVRGAVTPHLFESAVYKEVASHAITFIDQFGEAAKEHISDSLEDILKGDDKRKATSYKRLLENLFIASSAINAEYVISQLQRFVRQQSMKAAILRAVEQIEDGKVDEAELELQRGLNTQVVSFDMGVSLGDPKQSLHFLDDNIKPLMTGIDELDKRGIGLVKKEQTVFMAPPGVGKSWGMIHMGKWAILQRQTVVHITLEMSADRVAQRYIQAFFSVSNRDSRVRMPRMTKDSSGGMTDVFYEDIERLSLRDHNIRDKLRQKIEREFRRRPKLIIKQFPTSTLTVPQLNAYLDGLERYHKIIPDVVIIDYPELMALDTTDLRIAVGNNNKLLRGIAVARNHAQLIASQSNRSGAQARMVESIHAGEDFSKIATADTVITLSQTNAEKKLGLARLFTAKARNEEGGFITLITQAYAVGQFCLDSAHLGSSDYWSYVAAGGRKDDRDAEDE